MVRHVSVLLVDDDPDLADVVATFLEREADRFDVETAQSASEGLERLDTGEFDCVVSDYDMPGQDGVAFLEAVRERYPDLPFILYTGKGSEEVASDAISSGVTDYLQKGGGTDQYTVLANRVSNAVDAYHTASDLARKTRQDEVIATLSRTALRDLDLESLFEQAVEHVVDALGTEYAKVLDLSRDEGLFRLVAGVGWDEGVVDSATVETAERSQAGYTLSVSEPVVVEDLDAEDRFQGPHLLTDHDVRSGISVVIGSTDDPWGVFGTHATVPRSFTEDDVRFVQNVANVLGSAIERHESERQRRESERRFREIAELSPDTIFRLDTQGEFTYVSPAVESLLGYAPARLLGTNFRRYVAEDSLSTAAEGYVRVLEGEVVRELEVTLTDVSGSRVDVEVSASPVRHDGEVTFVQGFTRDITDRKERERAVRALKAQYETLVNHLPDRFVFLFDEDLRYTLSGGEELSAVGFSPADVEGATPHDLFPDALADELEHYYREALAGNEHTFEQEYRGERYRIQTVAVRDDDGDIVAGLAVAKNVTDRVDP